jgi:hypothetical protein
MSKLLAWMKIELRERSRRTQVKEVRKRSAGWPDDRGSIGQRDARVVGFGETAAGSAVATGDEAETSAMVAVATRA